MTSKDVTEDKKNNWPKPYFAVIFTAQRSLSGDDIYEITSDRMMQLAQQQPGFLGVESVRGDDGLGITVSYWRDRNQYITGAGIANILSLKRWGDRNFLNGTGFASPKLPTITPFLPTRLFNYIAVRNLYSGCASIPCV